MKRFLTSVVLFGVLVGVFSPFLGVKKALAVEMGNVFPNYLKKQVDGIYTIGSSAISVKVDSSYQPTSTQARLSIQLHLTNAGSTAVPAHDTTGDGIFNSNDAYGDWNSILDDSLLNSTDGIFLQLIEIPSSQNLQFQTPNNSDNFIQYIEGGNKSFRPKLVGGTNYKGDAYITDSGGGGYSAVNIGHFLWEKDPSKFFDKTDFSIVIPVTGLNPDKKYYYRMVLEEDGSNDTAFTEITASNFFQTLPAGSADPNLGAPLGEGGVVTSSLNEEAQENVFIENFNCGITNITGCFLELYYRVFYRLSSGLLSITARLMDVFIGFSISDNIYKDPSLILNGWKIVRDISNILFIFILLWTAINVVLGTHEFHANRTIATLIIVALLINFSLFFSRVIVDAGNILGRVFYNAITVTNEGSLENSPLSNEEKTGVKIKSLSGALMNGFSISKMVSNESFEKVNKNGGSVSSGTWAIVITLGIITNVVAAWTFFQCSFFFMGRILSLWFAMIFSPFAFISRTLHKLESTKRLGWTAWIQSITEASFMAPLFLFFIYLIMLFISSDFLGGLLQNRESFSGFEFYSAILLQFMFLIGLIQAAKKIASSMAGEFGGQVANVFESGAKFVGGAALGIATGGAALAARGTIGMGLAKMDSEALRDKATGKGVGGWLARRQIDAVEYGKKGSFDVRQSKIANTVSGAAGINMNSGLNIPGLKAFNTANTAGGLEGAKTREQIKIDKDKEKYGKEDKEKAHNIEHEIESRKDGIESAENEVERIKAKVDRIKGNGGYDPQTGQTESDALTELGAAKETLRTAKNGTGQTWTQADVASGKKKADGSLVTDADVAANRKSTDGMSLKELEKSLESNKKARAREYLLGRQQDAAGGGQFLTDEKRDALGNITKFGELDKQAIAGSGRYMARNFIREMYRGLSGGMGLGGVIAGVATGGLGFAGMAGGALVGGAFSGSTRGLASWLTETNTRLDAVNESVHTEMHSGKDKHETHLPKDFYKGPANDFFGKLFAGLNSGGGHSSPAGGHDDHGGGGGHH